MYLFNNPQVRLDLIRSSDGKVIIDTSHSQEAPAKLNRLQITAVSRRTFIITYYCSWTFEGGKYLYSYYIHVVLLTFEGNLPYIFSASGTQNSETLESYNIKQCCGNTTAGVMLGRYLVEFGLYIHNTPQHSLFTVTKTMWRFRVMDLLRQGEHSHPGPWECHFTV